MYQVIYDVQTFRMGRNISNNIQKITFNVALFTFDSAKTKMRHLTLFAQAFNSRLIYFGFIRCGIGIKGRFTLK